MSNLLAFVGCRSIDIFPESIHVRFVKLGDSLRYFQAFVEFHNDKMHDFALLHPNVLDCMDEFLVMNPGLFDNLLFGKFLAAMGPFSVLELFAGEAVLGGSTVASLTIGASEAILSPSLATGVFAAAIHFLSPGFTENSTGMNVDLHASVFLDSLSIDSSVAVVSDGEILNNTLKNPSEEFIGSREFSHSFSVESVYDVGNIFTFSAFTIESFDEIEGTLLHGVDLISLVDDDIVLSNNMLNPFDNFRAESVLFDVLDDVRTSSAEADFASSGKELVDPVLSTDSVDSRDASMFPQVAVDSPEGL